MVECIAQNKLYETLLGAQPVDHATVYRPITFCLVQAVDGVQIAYNTLTGELLELSPEEAKALSADTCAADKTTEKLIEKRFLVPLEHDDFGLAREALEMSKLFAVKEKHAVYTVLTTTDCNARCFYCYELGAARMPMSAKTAQDTAAFILRTRGDREVLFRWFGGEPLYNAEAIDTICKILRDAEVPFRSTMVSNAYLFDDPMVEKAKTAWNLREVQVTLDGTEAVYNKTKAFIYKDGKSAFSVVTDNIARLLAKKIRVSIRLNMGEHNKGDLYSLAEWLDTRYPDKTHLRVYAHLLFEKNAPRDADAATLRMRRAEELIEFERVCAEKGLLRAAPLPNKLRIYCCGLDTPDMLVVLPNGRLTKCEHMLDSGFVGDIYDGVTESARVQAYGERIDDRKMCAGCPAVPTCIQLKHCPNESHYICDPAKRLIEETTLRRRVEATYRAAKKAAAEQA